MLCSRWRCSELRRSPPPCGGGDDGEGGPFGNAGGGPAPTEDGDGGCAAGGSGTAGCVLRLTLSGAIEKEIDWDEDEVDCGGLGSPGEGMDVGFVYNEDDRSVLINFQVGTLAAGETGTDDTLTIMIAGGTRAGDTPIPYNARWRLHDQDHRTRAGDG